MWMCVYLLPTYWVLGLITLFFFLWWESTKAGQWRRHNNFVEISDAKVVRYFPFFWIYCTYKLLDYSFSRGATKLVEKMLAKVKRGTPANS